MTTDEEKKERHRLLHVLWTKAVGLPDYVKKEWMDLEASILRLEKAVEKFIEKENQ